MAGTEKSAIELLRERIAVTNTDDGNANGVPNNENAAEDEDDDSGNDDSSVEDESNDDAEDADDSQLEAKEDAIEDSEDKQKELEKEQKQAKDQKEKDRIQRKIDREVAKRKVLEEENEELKRQLEAKTSEDGDKLTKADAEKMAKDIANNAMSEKEFVDTCNKIADNGEKILDKDGKPLGKQFIEKMNDMAKEIGPIPPDMIYILGDLDNGSNVLHYLANDDNIDEAEKIYAMNTARKAIALTKIAAKLSAPKPKPISKVPAPNNPIGAGARGNKQLNDSMSDKEWIAERQRQLAEKRAAQR